ncbi:TetR/AcrR family transcriptional regulator [Streptomyces microflavus]|uniref:TetR/AcrR family transcriptional regulator n=1 Tax=Streptomyces microflavus TaxID=1919 RepID=UPI003443A79E
MSEEALNRHQRAAITKRKRTRAWILDAARSLFDEHGYHAVTRDDIAAKAGVGAATIHKHFSTKQTVAVAAYAPYVLGLMQATEKSLANGVQIDWVITEFIRELALELHDHPTMAYALLPLAQGQRTLTHSGNSEEVLDVSFQQLTELLGKLLERQACHDRSGILVVEVADFYLSGLLTWIVQHPERSDEDAAALLLSQLL